LAATVHAPDVVIDTLPEANEHAPVAVNTMGWPDPPPVAAGMYPSPYTAAAGAVEVKAIAWVRLVMLRDVGLPVAAW
jgi:hypothetical protein